MTPRVDSNISNASSIPPPPSPGNPAWLDHFSGTRCPDGKHRVKFDIILRSDMMVIQLRHPGASHPYTGKVLLPNIHPEAYEQIAPAGQIRPGPAIAYVDDYITRNPPI